MLIRANDLLTEIARKKSELMLGAFSAPPSDYAGFMRAVGRYAELVELENLVRELARKADE